MEYKERKITFLDTPGHEAFAAIRQHGAMLTDIVVIVVAADDGVKPQTAEAIKFAEAANAKIIVAINKIDKEGANIELTKAQLATEFNLNPEEWGGDTIMVPISAKTGQNLDKLLDMILLTADVDELKADEKIPAEGLVIERSAVVLIAGHPFDGQPDFPASPDLLREAHLTFVVAYIDFEDIVIILLRLPGSTQIPFEARTLRQGESNGRRIRAELIRTEVIDMPAGIHPGGSSYFVQSVTERLDSGLPADMGLRLRK